MASLRDEVVDTALAFLVAGIPILDGRVLDFGVLLYDDLDNGSVKLILVTLWGGTTLEVADVSPLVGDDQGTLKLPRVNGIDTEIGRELHRATGAFGDVLKTAEFSAAK